MTIKIQPYRIRDGKATRLQVVIPIVLDPAIAPDGKKVLDIASMTRHLHIEGNTILWVNNQIWGHVDKAGEYHIQLPALLQSAHDVYRVYKNPEVSLEREQKIA